MAAIEDRERAWLRLASSSSSLSVAVGIYPYFPSAGCAVTSLSRRTSSALDTTGPSRPCDLRSYSSRPTQPARTPSTMKSTSRSRSAGRDPLPEVLRHRARAPARRGYVARLHDPLPHVVARRAAQRELEIGAHRHVRVGRLERVARAAALLDPHRQAVPRPLCRCPVAAGESDCAPAKAAIVIAAPAQARPPAATVVALTSPADGGGAGGRARVPPRPRAAAPRRARASRRRGPPPPSPPVAGAGADVSEPICTAGNVCSCSLMKPSSIA